MRRFTIFSCPLLIHFKNTIKQTRFNVGGINSENLKLITSHRMQKVDKVDADLKHVIQRREVLKQNIECFTRRLDALVRLGLDIKDDLVVIPESVLGQKIERFTREKTQLFEALAKSKREYYELGYREWRLKNFLEKLHLNENMSTADFQHELHHIHFPSGP